MASSSLLILFSCLASLEQLEGLVLRTSCSYNGDTYQDGDVIEGPINCYTAECVGTTVQLVKDAACAPCTKMTRARFEVEDDLVPNIRQDIMARGKQCTANGEKKWGGHRLDKVVEDCIWIICNGDTGLYALEMNPFAACKCPTTTTEVTTTAAETTAAETTAAETTAAETTAAETTAAETTAAETTAAETTAAETTAAETTAAETTAADTTAAETTAADTTAAETTAADTTAAETTAADTTAAETTAAETTAADTTAADTTIIDSCETETTPPPEDSCDDTTSATP
ncbi:hypothetical protein Pcinc_020643 [Petrolisthes cinctipes]|uniref:Uncharacterized protein n=1 Tax=Petrolisthes cinctipes TaxID=88211 RepID=A0AAE1FIS7_PETCI|nr:hypothetical protein Pcinc_020643 [Petrolisthes cinctipes]